MADTLRVDLRYRPLRVAWVIGPDDIGAFRAAVRLSHTLWGGRYNPIIPVSRQEAGDFVELFQPDLIIDVGDHADAKAFSAQYPHLAPPFFPDELFLHDSDGAGRCHLLDVHNERVEGDLGVNIRGSSIEECARITVALYLVESAA
ncbi:MAG: hypothetical protein WA840_00950 [Caulobacteraceae bacterium]